MGADGWKRPSMERRARTYKGYTIAPKMSRWVIVETNEVVNTIQSAKDIINKKPDVWIYEKF